MNFTTTLTHFMEALKFKVLRKYSTTFYSLTYILVGTLFFITYSLKAQVPLVSWDVSGTVDYGDSPLAPTSNSNLESIVGLTRGAGVNTGSSDVVGGWGGTSWESTYEGAILDQSVINFGFKPKAGFAVSLLSIEPFSYRRSGTGPQDGRLEYTVNGGGSFSGITQGPFFFGSSSSGGAAVSPIRTLNGDIDLQQTKKEISFRLVPYNSTGSDGSFHIYDVVYGSDFTINGRILGTTETTLALDACLDFAGTAKTFAVEGDGLTSTDVTITAPASFEISLDGITFYSSLTLSPLAGNVSKIYYVRLKSGLVSGAYNGKVTVTGGGFTSGAGLGVELSGTVHALPTALVSSINPICVGDDFPTVSIALTGNAPFDLTYTNGTISSGPSSVSASPFEVQSVADGEVFTATALTDAKGCVALSGQLTGSSSVVVNSLPEVSVVASNGSPSGLAGVYNGGEAIGLTATITSGSGDYSWAGPDGFTGSNNGMQAITGASSSKAGIYTVTLTNTNECKGTATVNVIVYDNILYVDDSGDDGNTGNEAHPLATIQKAVDVSVSGGIIHVGAGTYSEQVLVNKEVSIKGVGASKPIIDFTGTVTGKPTLFDVSANKVTIENLNFKVDLAILKGAIIASAAGLDDISIKDNLIEPYGTPSSGTYGDRNAVSVNYGGSTNYRVATGGVDNVTFTGNTVMAGTYPTMFRSGISVDEVGGTFSDNTLETINHDIIARFGSNGNITIDNNNINGGGIELTEQNAGAGTLSITNNILEATWANGLAPYSPLIRLKNNYTFRPTIVSDNTFSNHIWGLSLENYNTINVNNNTFTPLANSTTYRHITVDTKELSSSSSGFYQPNVNASITNNTFNGSGTLGGTALSFANQDNDSPLFGLFTVGTNGNENSFDAGVQTYIKFENLTGTVNPNATTAAPWNQNLDLTFNLFDGKTGATASKAENFAIEDKITHKLDNASLGLVRVKSNELFVTTNSGNIQRAVNAASASDVVNVNDGTYSENITLDKKLTLSGMGDNTIIQGAGTGNAITYLASGSGLGANDRSALTDVKLKGFVTGVYTDKQVDFVKLENVNFDANTSYGVNFNNTTGILSDWVIDSSKFDGSSVGIKVASKGGVNGLKVANSIFSNNSSEAIHASQHDSSPGSLSNVEVSNNVFTLNGHANNKSAIYAEKLDHALIKGNTFTNNGFSTNARGMIINLKYDDYSDIMVSENIINETRGGTLTGGYAVSIAARDDASYASTPASLGTAVISNNEIDGFYIGVGIDNNVDWNSSSVTNNKILNSGAAVSATGAQASLSLDIHQNDLSGSTYALYNGVTGSNFDASCNWFGTAVSGNIQSKVFGDVTFDPYLIVGGDGVGTGFQPTGTCDGSPIVISSAVSSPELCETKGSVLVTFSGGQAPYEFSWTGGTATAVAAGPSYDITNLDTGTYTITISDALGSSTSATTSVMYLPVTNTTSSNSYATIQEAIDAASAADEIVVCEGTYNESLTIPLSINLVGPHAGISGCDTRGSEATIEGYIKVTSSDVTINGFRLLDGALAPAGELAAVHIVSALSNVSIMNNYIERTGVLDFDVSRGVVNEIGGTTNLTVSNNYFTGWHTGTYLQNADADVINNCYVLNEVGISSDTPIDVLVDGNDILNNAFEGVGIGGTVGQMTISNNNITGNLDGVHNYSSTEINAGSNWWGDAAGPSDFGSGTGDKVSANVNFCPLLNDEVGFGTAIDCRVLNISNGESFVSIQAAIDDAETSTGDTLVAESGTYNENVVVNKELVILGANADTDCAGRSGESIVSVASGLPFNITADNVVINGFEITAAASSNAVVIGNVSNASVMFNNIHNIGTTFTGGNIHAVVHIVPNASNNSNITVSDNCINDISSTNLVGYSSSGIGILQGSSTGVLTGLNIERNVINNVTVSDAPWSTGKIAYGIQINVGGGSSYLTTTGNVVNAVINNNEISNLSGHIATAIALEGNTEDAIVTGNKVSNLTSTKSSDKAGGGYDLNGLKFENNAFVSTVTVENNSFEVTSFTNVSTSNRGYGVVNYVPGVTATLGCNWFGTAVYNEIEDNGIAGKVLSKATADIVFSPYLTDGGDGVGTGFQPTGTCAGSPIVISSAVSSPELCETKGSIAVTFSGGTAPFDFSWSGGGTANGVSSPYSITGLDAGSYTVTVTDNNGSTTTSTATVAYLPVTNISSSLNYATIQAAINGATASDTIEVCAGLYDEQVTLNKSLTILGPNATISAVTGTRAPEARLLQSINIGAVQDVTISGLEFFEVQTPTTWTIYIQGNSENFTFENNRFIDINRDAIRSGISSSTVDITVKGNLVQGITDPVASGIFLGGISGTSIIADNKLDLMYNGNPTGYSGIQTPSATGLTISGNEISNTTNQGIQLAGVCGDVIIENNTISNTNTSNGADKGAIRLYGSDFTGTITIRNNALTSSYNGLAIKTGENISGKNIIVEGNDLSGNSNLSIYNGATSGALSTTCNWFGSTDPVTINMQVSGDVTFVPFGTNGTDDDLVTLGFQPVAESCIGLGPVVVYNQDPLNTGTVQSSHLTIQEAINASTTLSGYFITVAEGTYNERVLIDKSLTLQGAGADSSLQIIDGTGLVGKGDGIQIANGVKNVNISNLSIQNFSGASGNLDAGIYAIGGNDGLSISKVAIKDNVGGSGIYANGPIDGVTITNSLITGHTSGARGIVIWNGFKQNIIISGNTVNNSDCCGIELQDGTASAVNISNNTIDIGIGDNGMGLSGLNELTGPNVIDNNTITGGGRYGIEIKNPAGGVTVSNNTLTLTTQSGNSKDRAGIAVFRRAYNPTYGYVNIPNGVTISGNSITGYQQTVGGSNSDGFGIVVEGTNHIISNNTLTNNDIGIQQQAGHTPYTENAVGDGNDADVADLYFGRGNSPELCNVTLTNNVHSGNTVDERIVIGGGTGTIVTEITPTVDAITDIAACKGESLAEMVFTGNNLLGVVYDWTNNNTAIGLSASGTGNLPAFTATNTGITGLTAEITVTPTVNGCSGTPQMFTISINPEPVVDIISSQDACIGGNVSEITFTGTGTSFDWINTNTSIGLAASGSGDIADFTAVNTSGVPQTAYITVTPSFTFGGKTCSGTPKTFLITVQDEEMAEVDCPENIIIDNEVGMCSAVVNFDLPMAFDNVFFDGFESATSETWLPFNSAVTKVSSGTDGITSSEGASHGEINTSGDATTGVFSRIGGYSTDFGDGYRNRLDVYIDKTDPTVTADTYAWALSSAANGKDGNHRRDFIFHAASNASGNILIAGDNGSTGLKRNDLASLNHYEITASGWYTYEWLFKDAGDGSLAVDMNLLDNSGNVLFTETRNTTVDVIDTEIGGNRYMWFTFITAEKLRIDNLKKAKVLPTTSDYVSGTAFPVGTTTVTVSATNACSVATTCTFDVTVNDVEAPVFADCPTDVVICSDEAEHSWTHVKLVDNCVVQGGMSELTYQLSGATTSAAIAAGAFDGSTSGTETFNTGITTVTYSAKDSSGNVVSNLCSFTVEVKEAAVVEVGDYLAICENGSVILAGSFSGASTSITWTDGGLGGVFSPNANDPVAVYTPPAGYSGTISLTITSDDPEGPCPAGTATTSLVVNALPVVVLPNVPAICAGQNVNLTVSEGVSYAWSGPSGFSSVLQSPSISEATVGASGVYSVTVMNVNSCVAMGTVSVTVYPNFAPTISADNNEICKGESVVLTASCASNTDIFRWTTPGVNQGNGVSALSSTGTLTVDKAGTYSGYCETVNGCISQSNSVVVSEKANCGGGAFISISPELPIICPGGSVTLTATGCTGTLTWYANGASPVTGNSVSLSPTVTTSYFVSCNSGGSASVDVRVAQTNMAESGVMTTGKARVKATEKITSVKKIGDATFTPAPNVIYEAGRSIELNPGFSTEHSTVFRAEIKVCN